MLKFKNEIALTWACLAVVLLASIFFLVSVFTSGGAENGAGMHPLESALFVVVVGLLIFGNVVYHLSRLGFLYRKKVHSTVARPVLEAMYDRPATSVAVLIPSYKEEERVLLQTLLSAALLDYPHRRVVVLLDDPPTSTGDALVALQSARNLVRDVHESFAAWSRLLHREHLKFTTRLRTGGINAAAEAFRVAQLYEQTASWVEDWALELASSSDESSAHSDHLFIEKILKSLADDHRVRAHGLRAEPADTARLSHEYRRLAALLSVDITSFERKRYVNLSHQPNKAMNLNSYIGLIGGSYREVACEGGIALVACEAREATLIVPPADYLLTLDADSIVLPDYALRLVNVMDRDPNIAVAQTPYSAFPGAPGILERIAGATTDIQYVIHQGFTWLNATYWVGANAMLRLTALRDIRTFVEERGYRLPVFIQDRTVIEDTGSTVDLVRRGWELYNYPERLAYSATPPDFGSLIVQRRRWSNGGLIILPDLLKTCWTWKGWLRRLPEMAVRAHYLFSPAVGNLGLLLLMLYRFNDGLSSAWLPLAAAPYYVLYGRDLRLAGYRWSDLFFVYVLNLLLIPVNLAGVFRSLQQAATGKKSPFARTPKIQSRTRTPPVHVALQWLFLAYLVQASLFDLAHGHYSHAVFALANCWMLFCGIGLFLGWRESYADLTSGLRLPSVLKARAMQPARPLVQHAPQVARAAVSIEPTIGRAQRGRGL